MRGGRRGGHNGGAISDGNARHVGMRRTPPLLIRERFVAFFIDVSRNAMVKIVFLILIFLNINSSFQTIRFFHGLLIITTSYFHMSLFEKLKLIYDANISVHFEKVSAV